MYSHMLRYVKIIFSMFPKTMGISEIQLLAHKIRQSDISLGSEFSIGPRLSDTVVHV